MSFDPIITGKQVQQAVVETLTLWAPAYLAEVGDQAGVGRETLPMFRSFTKTPNSIDKWVEAQLPACIVVSKGLAGAPARYGDGTWDAPFAVEVGAIVSGNSQESTLDLVQLYVAALRALLLQQPSLGGLATGVDWLDESWDDMPFGDSRSIAAGAVLLSFEIPSVVNSRSGPITPPDNPIVNPDPLPTVEEVDITTKRTA